MGVAALLLEQNRSHFFFVRENQKHLAFVNLSQNYSLNSNKSPSTQVRQTFTKIFFSKNSTKKILWVEV